MTNNLGTESSKKAKEYSATEARQKFSELFDEAVYNGPVYVVRRKHRVALIDAELLNQLTELQAAIDSKEAVAALEEYNDKGGIKLSRLKEELGID